MAVTRGWLHVCGRVQTDSRFAAASPARPTMPHGPVVITTDGMRVPVTRFATSVGVAHLRASWSMMTSIAARMARRRSVSYDFGTTYGCVASCLLASAKRSSSCDRSVRTAMSVLHVLPTTTIGYVVDGLVAYSVSRSNDLPGDVPCAQEFFDFSNLCRRQCGSCTASHVLSVGHGFEVRGSDAGSISTQVIQLQPVGNRPVFTFPVDPMRAPIPLVYPHMTISAVIERALPHPTRGRVAAVLFKILIRG